MDDHAASADMSADEVAERFQCLHEFHKEAKATLGTNEWDYLAGAAETETTHKRNRLAIDTIAFRPRVLRDVLDLDTHTDFLGRDLRLPVILAPIGSLQDFHPGGGATAAAAAGDFGCAHMVSSVSKPGLEKTAEAAPDAARIFQLYVRGDADWVDDHVRRAIDQGYVAFCYTVDLDHYSRRERDLAKRYKSTARQTVAQGEQYQAKFTWDDVSRLKDKFDIPVILKGIATAEDAAIAVERGVDVVYVSNHGGRQLDHSRGSFDVLPEVVEACAGRAKIVVDGCVLRGSDIVKAMAMGADAVGIGRLQALALAAAGRPGIVRMLELLEIEVRTALALLGVTRFDQLDVSYLHPAAAVVEPRAFSAFPLLDEGY